MTLTLNVCNRYRMRRWSEDDAQARFNEFLDASLHQGPQMVTRDGADSAVLMSVSEWRSMQRRNVGRSLKELLLSEQGRYELRLPAR
jgi:antitoxin Phd